MAEVFMCEKGQLTDPSKAALRKAGVVVVEVDDPSKCQFIRSSETIPADDMLWAALDALQQGGDYSASRAQREALSSNLLALLVASRRSAGKPTRQHDTPNG